MQVQYDIGTSRSTLEIYHWLHPVLPQAMIVLNLNPSSRSKLSYIISESSPQAQTLSSQPAQIYLSWKLQLWQRAPVITKAKKIAKNFINNYNLSMTIKQLLQLFFLIALCTADSIQKQPLFTFDVQQAENAFNRSFCTIRYIKRYCEDSVNYISSLKEAGNFNLSASPIKDNSFNIKIIEVYKTHTSQTYKFPNGRLVNKDHLSLLFVPVSTKVRGIVVYFHKNTLGKWNGPSDSVKEYQGIAGLYASQGYVVLVPDLLGYRNDTDPRPFLLYPQVSVRSAVSTLNQLVPFLKSLDGLIPNLYTVGYGEGGSYAVWLSYCISLPDQCQAYTLSKLAEHSLSLDDFYHLKGAASLSGALDLSRTMYDFLTKNVGLKTRGNDFTIQSQQVHNFVKGPLLISLLDGYLLHSLNLQNKLEAALAKNFFDMNCSVTLGRSLCDINGQHLNITSAIRSNGSEGAIFMAFALSTLAQSYSGERSVFLGKNFKDYLKGQKNSVLSLASRSIIANQTFYNTLIDATIVEYAQKAASPVYVWSLAYDSVIPSNNTRNFAKSGKKNPFVSSYEFDNKQYQSCDLGLMQIGPVEHNQAESMANIFALQFIQQNK